MRKFVKIGKPGYKGAPLKDHLSSSLPLSTSLSASSPVTKQQDARTGAYSLLFQIEYPEIGEGILPRHRVMSAFEQRVEAPDRNFQYLLFAAEPYETIAFKVREGLAWQACCRKCNDNTQRSTFLLLVSPQHQLPNRDVDPSDEVFWSRWDPERKTFYMQFAFKPDRTAIPQYAARPTFQPAANPLNPYQAM